MSALLDKAHLYFREFTRFDDAHPLPIGDPSSPAYRTKKSEVRDIFAGAEQSLAAAVEAVQGSVDAVTQAAQTAVAQAHQAASAAVEQVEGISAEAEGYRDETADIAAEAAAALQAATAGFTGFAPGSAIDLGFVADPNIFFPLDLGSIA